jgi:RNA polymerase sigma factor (sigma-70 family)
VLVSLLMIDLPFESNSALVSEYAAAALSLRLSGHRRESGRIEPMSEERQASAREESGIRDTTAEVAAIFVANHRSFLRFLERRVGSRAIAEDILQEAFVRGMGRLDSHQEESVVAWFYRTLRNAAVDYHRRHKTAGRALDAFAAESEDKVEPDGDMRAAVCQCVQTLADTLKPEYAAALKRIEVDGVSVKDYATEVGISSSNAAVRIFRAREALRKQVNRSCGTCAEHGCLDCTCGSSAAGCGPSEAVGPGHRHG